MTEQTDIGEFLAVPEEERSDVDPAPEYNADAGFDVQVVPNGVVRELSTAEGETLAASKRDDDGDGAPLEFLAPYVQEGN